MKYLNKTFSVGGPLKGVTDDDWSAIFSKTCAHCGKPLRGPLVECYHGDIDAPALCHVKCYAAYFGKKGTE